MDTGKLLITRAPAKYIVSFRVATLETSTLAIGGITFASRERPYIEARPDINQGAPNIGKSMGMADFILASVALRSAVTLLMRCRRLILSVSSVARSATSMLTWLLAVVSPASRRLTGTAALSDFSGNSLLSSR